jgi:hypothetical protein
MSSIAGAGAANGLYQYLQNNAAVTQPAASDASAATANTAATTDPSSAQGAQGAHHHHRHGHAGAGGSSQLFQQIQQAVSSALQSAGTSGANPNQTIEDAITKVFQNNTSAPASGTTNPNDSAASANTSATTGTPGADGTSALQAFFNTLQNAGVNPQQFHQDFLTAVQNAQNGNVDPTTAYQSLPPGSILNVLG